MVTRERFSNMGIKLSDIKDPALRRLVHITDVQQNGVERVSRVILPAMQEDKRVRQDETPKLNKLETDWRNVLRVTLPPGTEILEQAIRLRIGNGAWYKPDLAAVVNGVLTLWECKGPKKVKGVAKGVLAIKAAASLFKHFKFMLVWKDNNVWKTQEILP